MSKTKQSNDDDEASTSQISHRKRRRRVSDVIDSHGVIEFIADLQSPKRLKQKSTEVVVDSPDPGYSSSFSTPETSRKKVTHTPEVSKELVSKDASQVDYPYNNFSPMKDLPRAIMVTEKDAECYKMDHLNRGKCVVFNHELFDNNTNREGSSQDARKIKQTFEKLGFEVIILHNLKHCEVIECITKLSQEDHSQSDCICIFMLTHGTFDDLIYAKDVAYKADDIWTPFTSDKCKSLAGKPKLFFFQNCRGDKLDGGTVLHQNMTTKNDSHVKSYKIPTHADFLIAHSTVQGFYSWRNPAHGTWYVQTLCDVIDKYYESTDLLKMLTITARRVATDFTSYNDLNPHENNQKQVPSVSSMLLRDVYFA